MSSVDSSPIALPPLPDRQGSMWVSASGWKEDVIATPRELALLAQPQRRDRAAEAAADDDHVPVTSAALAHVAVVPARASSGSVRA